MSRRGYDVVDKLPHLGTLIDGVWHESGEAFDVLNKYTRKPFARAHAATRDQVSEAVAVASRAMRETPCGAPHDRKTVLQRASVLLDKRREELMPIMIAEAGFTVSDAKGEIDRACVTLNLSGDAAVRLIGSMVPFAASPGAHSRIGYTQRFPIGVVCAITPFNAPLNTVLHKIAPAYAAGNAVILKPSAFTPLTSAFLAEILLECGMEAPYLALLQGGGDTVGQWLLEEQDIAFYNFTGSTRVGSLIQKAAGLRRTQMELGSIASTIICKDAEIEKALDRVARAGLRKAGQVCTSVQRLYVERPCLETVTEGLVARARAMVAGNPADPKTEVGPMISEDAAKRAESWIAEAVAGGARLLCGGEREGSVLRPAILVDVPKDSTAWCREIFAPVIEIVAFDEFSEALDGANSTPFGLSVGVFTTNIRRAFEASRTLRFGTVMINQSSSARSDVMPFGGVKASGFGKEGPDYAIKEMTEERLTIFNE